MTTQIARQTRRVTFLAVDPQPITPEAAKAEQTRLGYSPAGYGFEGFASEVKNDPAGPYHVAVWWCSASCE
jgi:hypothetical protein